MRNDITTVGNGGIVGGCRCSVRRRGTGWSDLEERCILVSVIVLFACVFPRNPKDALLVILPDQAGIHAAVDLIDQPLSQFPIAGAD